ncbi:hypothetical protein Ahia01_001254600 [Argonauta hians]
MNGLLNMKISTLFAIFISTSFLSTLCSSAAIRNESSPTDNRRAELPLSYYTFCNYGLFSAAFLGPDDTQYFFARKIYKLKGSILEQYSRKDIFPSCPYYVDAMVYSEFKKKAYIFKGNEVFVYRYVNDKFLLINHKAFGRDFPNIPEAAFVYHNNIYLLKDNFLYLWSDDSDILINGIVFPTSVLWKNIPQKIESVFEDKNGNFLYFWTRNDNHLQYYQVDNNMGKIVKSGDLKSFFKFCSNQ